MWDCKLKNGCFYSYSESHTYKQVLSLMWYFFLEQGNLCYVLLMILQIIWGTISAPLPLGPISTQTWPSGRTPTSTEFLGLILNLDLGKNKNVCHILCFLLPWIFSAVDLRKTCAMCSDVTADPEQEIELETSLGSFWPELSSVSSRCTKQSMMDGNILTWF